METIEQLEALMAKQIKLNETYDETQRVDIKHIKAWRQKNLKLLKELGKITEQMAQKN